MPVHVCGVLVRWHNVKRFVVPPLMQSDLFTACRSWLERAGCSFVLPFLLLQFRRIIRTQSLVIVLVLQGHGTLLPLNLLSWSWCGVFTLPNEASVNVNVMTPTWVREVVRCSYRFRLAFAVSSIIITFASFIVGCDFYSSTAYLSYRRSEEVDWSFDYSVHRWFQYGFAYGRIRGLVEVVLL